MEEEERPRKQQKLSVEGQAELEPAMSSAVDGARHGGENVDDQTTTTHEKNKNDNPEDEHSANGENDDSDNDANEKAFEGEGAAMSKNQMKKLRRKEAWEASRADWKAKKKQKVAAKKERKRNALEEARKQGKDAEAEVRKAYESTKQRHPSTLVPLTFVMDCGFDELMMEKERKSLASQLTRCYSDNSRSKYRVHYVISSFDKLLKERFDTVLGKTHENWKGVRTMPEDYMQTAEMAKDWMKEPKGGQFAGMFTEQTDAKPEDGEIVYLSSDSPNTLTELKPYSTYIIGGLVDKNRHKGICYKQATERGLTTAKLPIGEYIQMASRAVLATNHVMEIMLRWLEVGDWGEAFMQVIPQRKGGQLRNPKEAGAAGDAEKEDSAETEAEAGQPTEE